MPLSVAAQVYILVREFVEKADPLTPIEFSDLYNIGDALDTKPSLDELTRQGWLVNPEPGIYLRRHLDHY